MGGTLIGRITPKPVDISAVTATIVKTLSDAGLHTAESDSFGGIVIIGSTNEETVRSHTYTVTPTGVRAVNPDKLPADSAFNAVPHTVGEELALNHDLSYDAASGMYVRSG